MPDIEIVVDPVPELHELLRFMAKTLRGVEGACLSIVGALGESLGFIIFPSLVAF